MEHMMKKYPFIFLTMLVVSSVFAQSEHQDWLDKEQMELKQYEDRESAAYRQFKLKEDSLFSEYLKKEWQTYQVYQGLTLKKEPKPAVPPVAAVRGIPDEVGGSSVRVEEIHIPQAPILKTAESIETFISKILNEKETLEFDFLRLHLKLNYDPEIMKIHIPDSLSKEMIGDFWTSLARSDHEDLMSQIKQIKKEMRLNDWGCALFIHRIAAQLFPDSEKKQTLTVWFLMLKSGYEVKVGYNQNDLYLLLPSVNTIYNVPYYMSDQIKYYIVDFDRTVRKAGQVYTYQAEYSGHPVDFKLVLDELPVTGDSLAEKTVQFLYKGQVYPLHLSINEPLIDFFNDYPQTDFPVYFCAPLSQKTGQALVQSLKPLIENQSEVEAVNTLLHFVQTSFGYRKDDEQFGYEKPMFAEETLFYPYSDCEDRSVLFSRLVKNILDLDVIGLDYPGHISAAVNFSTELPGDFIEHQGRRYLICDPTYIHANIGECMPEFRTVKPGVIEIN